VLDEVEEGLTAICDLCGRGVWSRCETRWWSEVLERRVSLCRFLVTTYLVPWLFLAA
jgi:hypothetical protein